MNTVWLDPMEEEEELNAFLLEEQLIMNHHQQQQQQQINDVPRQQLLMNTIAINTTTATASINTRAEDIISWLDTEEDDDDDDDDDGDVYIPSLPAAVTADDGQEVVLQENLYSNLQMDHRHQVEEEGGGLLLFHNNNQEDQTLIMDAFDHHPQPTIINPDNVDHFQVPESPFLLDLLCNINEFDILHSSHNHHHRAVVPEEIPPENDYHQPSSSCSSPPLVDQNLFFDDPDMSEFTLINDVGSSHDTVTSTTTVQLVDTSSSTSRDHHTNEDHSRRSNENVINNVSTMIDKVTVNATNGVTAVNQGDDDENDDDDENNGHEEKSMDAHGDNPKAMISTNTSTTSPLASAVACKNLVSERNRRKRLSQQLLALRSLVPNITKMDKRSVLVDALAYLRNLDEETTKLQNELKQQPSPPQSNTIISSTTATDTASCPDNLTAGNLCNPRMLPRTKPRAIITEIDTEKIENQRFVVKITCKVRGGNSNSSSSSSSSISSGVGGDVLRVMESLGFDITYTSTTTTPLYHQASKPQNQLFLLTTLFIRVRNNKHGKMTEEKLRECISNRALRCGLTFQKPPAPTTTIVP